MANLNHTSKQPSLGPSTAPTDSVDDLSTSRIGERNREISLQPPSPLSPNHEANEILLGILKGVPSVMALEKLENLCKTSKTYPETQFDRDCRTLAGLRWGTMCHLRLDHLQASVPLQGPSESQTFLAEQVESMRSHLSSQTSTLPPQPPTGASPLHTLLNNLQQKIIQFRAQFAS